MVNAISSAKGVLSLLRESDNGVLLFALRRVLQLMSTFWCEISADLPLLEELSAAADLAPETRGAAALAASQVYFHLGAYGESVQYALAAGKAFDSQPPSLFTRTILSRCIDQYVAHQETPEAERVPLDPRLETLFESLTGTWVAEGQSAAEVRELVGFTIRARRLDFLEKVLRRYLAATHSADVLHFTYTAATTLLTDIELRRRIVLLLVELYQSGEAAANDIALVHCLLLLGDVEGTAGLVARLLESEAGTMMALQIAFVLFEKGNQHFLSEVAGKLSERLGVAAYPGGPIPGEDAQVEAVADAADGGEVNPVLPTDPAPLEVADLSPAEKVLAVLTGAVTTSLHLKFLYARCCADMHVVYQLKRGGASRAVMVNATIIANSLMYCGTSVDGFMRDNITWLRRADYWAKFTATASIGVIHRGHVDKATRVLESYLPKARVPALAHQEAGALYALGLIHAPLGAARDRSVIHYLRDNLRKFSSNEQMVHGASLGLGLAAVGLQDEELYDLLFTCVTGSDAVGGEGAAVGIGMLLMGSGNEAAVQSLRNLADDESQREKVIRGCCMAMALISMGREDAALPLADELLASGDPWLRVGGCFVVGMAFAGVESVAAIERLLSVAVKDSNDDVRRNAVMMVGFLTLRNPSMCLDFTNILLDSYNPHVRYGVALALGISAAGSGSPEVVDVLWELRRDLVDFVRQGALISLALVLVQVAEADNPKAKELRTELATVAADFREDVCVRFGAAVATGILDGGGRNCTYSLQRAGKSVLGMFLFSQYWYWYPYTLMLSLAMQPTCFIGLNERLEMPEYRFTSHLPPRFFAIPKSVLQEKKERKEAATTAVVLSTTRKEEERRQRLRRGSTGNTNNSQNNSTAAAGGKSGSAAGADKAKAEDEGKEKEKDKAEAAEAEPATEVLHNPCRVTLRQQAVVRHDADPRFTPLKSRAFGICLLRDNTPDAGPQKLIDTIEIVEEDAPAPEPFQYP